MYAASANKMLHETLSRTFRIAQRWGAEAETSAPPSASTERACSRRAVLRRVDVTADQFGYSAIGLAIFPNGRAAFTHRHHVSCFTTGAHVLYLLQHVGHVLWWSFYEPKRLSDAREYIVCDPELLLNEYTTRMLSGTRCTRLLEYIGVACFDYDGTIFVATDGRTMPCSKAAHAFVHRWHENFGIATTAEFGCAPLSTHIHTHALLCVILLALIAPQT